MTISMYAASVPVFVKMLTNAKGWLMKAQAHAEAKKFDSGVLLNDRLAPDMLNFTKQIQDRKSRCSSSAGSRLARRAQTELVHLLRQRVARPVQDLRGLIDVAARLLQSGAHVVDARRARAEL